MDFFSIGTVGSYVRSVKAADSVGRSYQTYCDRKQSRTDRAELSSRRRGDDPVSTYTREQAKEASAASGSDKSDEPKTVSQIIKEQSDKISGLFSSDEDKDNESGGLFDSSSDDKLTSIRAKLSCGKRLSLTEQQYLSQKDPAAYSSYQHTETMRKMYRSMLRCCRTRDQVTSMRLSNSVAALSEFRHSAGKDGGEGVAGLNAALEDEMGDYVKSAEYRRLPTAAERDKFYSDLAKAKKYEREKKAAEREKRLEKTRSKQHTYKRKKAKKVPGDGKQTVAQVMASKNARKVLAAAKRPVYCPSYIEQTDTQQQQQLIGKA